MFYWADNRGYRVFRVLQFKKFYLIKRQPIELPFVRKINDEKLFKH